MAHPLSVSYAELTIGDRIGAVLRLPLDDVDLLLRLDRDLDNVVSPAEIQAARPAIEAYVLEHVRMTSGAAALEGAVTAVGSWEDSNRFPYVEATLSFTRPGPAGVTIQVSALTDLYSDHRTLARIDRGDGRVEEFVFQQGATWTGQSDGSRWETLRSFVVLGIEHIFTGYDHILFLFGLLLVNRGFRSLVGIVTSFTVAHSLTLGAATLGLIQPSPWTIEAAIALSVAYIGFENLFLVAPRPSSSGHAPLADDHRVASASLPGDHRVSSVGSASLPTLVGSASLPTLVGPASLPGHHRWKITFVFGLVHGFGFANILREMDLPRSGLALSLFSFNLGVELGQIAIVTLMFPVILALGRSPHRVLITRLASACIIAVGLLWFYQRLS